MVIYLRINLAGNEWNKKCLRPRAKARVCVPTIDPELVKAIVLFHGPIGICWCQAFCF